MKRGSSPLPSHERTRKGVSRLLSAAAVSLLAFALLAGDSPADPAASSPEGMRTRQIAGTYAAPKFLASMTEALAAESGLSDSDPSAADAPEGGPEASAAPDWTRDAVELSAAAEERSGGNPDAEPDSAEETDRLAAFSDRASRRQTEASSDGGERETLLFQGRYVPVSRSVEPNRLQSGDFVWAGDRLRYTGDRYDVSFGIDVSSHHNADRPGGKLDWEAARADGVEFAFVRVGFRGTTAGALYEDPCYKENIIGALAAGIRTGAYLYSQAVSVAEAEEEADYILARLADLPIDAPVCYDWEVPDSSSRAYRVSRETATACAEAFCRKIEAAGYDAILYESKYTGYMKYDQDALSPYMSWYPQYPGRGSGDPCPDYLYQMDVWQFSDRCSVAGIGKRTDGNLWFRLKRDTGAET